MRKRRPAPGAYGPDYQGPRPANIPAELGGREAGSAGEVVVIVYDEKHHTYAACVGADGPVKRERLSSAGFSNWVMKEGRIGLVRLKARP